MSAQTPTVVEALSAVMGDVSSIGKTSRVSSGPAQFNFRGVDDVVMVVGPALRNHGVVFTPSRVVSVEHERYETAKGSSMDGVTVVVEYTITGPAGDTMTAAAAGQAADSGDKAVPKAMSVAYRTVLLEALCVPTGEPDPDSQVHERVAPQTDPRVLIRASIQSARPSWTRDEITADFKKWSNGADVLAADVTQLNGYLNHLRSNAA